MTTSRPRLPAPFPEPMITVAEGRRRGIAGRLRRQSLTAPFHGVRSATPVITTTDRVHALLRVVPTGAASHATAATLLGLPLPRRLETEACGIVHVMVPTAQAPPRRPGVTGHRGLERRRVLVSGGLRVIGPADTWCDLAPVLTLTELVVLGDAIADRDGSTGVLHEVLRRRAGFRGRRAVLAALGQVRVGSASPGETRTRLALTGAGLAEPALNRTILDRAGGFVAIGDLVWPEHRVVVEYLGDQHFDRARTRADVDRRRLLESEGWVVIEVTSRDLATPQRVAELVRRVSAALATRPGG